MRVLVLLSFAAASAIAQSTLSLQLDEIAGAELTRQHLTGMAVAAVRQGRLVYAKGFGVTSVETKVPVASDTLFRIGSTTKMFVAAAVVKLAEQGRLHLDSPVGDYIVGLNPKVAQLTPRQILSHTSGLMDESPYYGGHDDDGLARSTASWTDATFFTEPGKVFSYSNLDYALAGRLIEVVKGEPFANAMRSLIFEPLGMTRTTFRPTTAMTYPLALGHSAQRKVVRPAADNVAMWPAEFLYTSADDYARFLLAFLNIGKIGENQVLSPSLIAEISKPAAAEPGQAGKSYGFGLEIDSSRAVRLVQHGGVILGYTSFLMMAPEYKTGVVVMCNQSESQSDTIAKKLLDRLMPVTLGVATEPAPPAGGDLSRYTGKYVNGASAIQIAMRGGKLTGKRATGNSVTLSPTRGQCFRGGSIAVCFTDGYAYLGLRAFRKL